MAKSGVSVLIRDVRVYRKGEYGTSHFVQMGKFRCNRYNKQKNIEIVDNYKRL